MRNLGFVEGMAVGITRTQIARQRGDVGKVFDWDKAARLIAEHQPKVAEAGLAGDWDYTGGEIWRASTPIPRDETYTYLASAWATPQLVMDDVTYDCWVAKTETDWDSATYWPDSALAIIAAARGGEE